MSHQSDYWGFVIRELNGYGVVYQTNDEEEAVRFCMNHQRPAKVLRTFDDEEVYRNC